MENQEGALRDNKAKSKNQKTRATEKEQGDCVVPSTKPSTTTSVKPSTKPSDKAGARCGIIPEPIASREPEKEPRKRISEKQPPTMASEMNKAKRQEKLSKASPAKPMHTEEAVARAVKVDRGAFDDETSAGRSGSGKSGFILTSPKDSAGNSSPNRENGKATGPVNVKARLYECRALCFVDERLWKPGEKQYSALPLNALHWEFVTEEAE